MTDAEVRQRLDRAVSRFAARFGTRRAWSDMHDIDPNYTGQVLRGTRRASEKILTALGLRRVVAERTESLNPRDWEMGRQGQELLDAKIEDALARHGSKRAWADHLGVSDVYVHMVCSGRKPPSRRILDDLGLVLIREERIEEVPG